MEDVGNFEDGGEVELDGGEVDLDGGEVDLDGGEVDLDNMSDSEDQSRPRKRKLHFQEKTEHEKNQVRDKVKKNQESHDERKIKNISEIKNNIRRNAEWLKLKREKKKEKRMRQEARKKEAEALGDEAPPKLVPKTIDSMREYDETTVGGKEGTEEDEAPPKLVP